MRLCGWYEHKEECEKGPVLALWAPIYSVRQAENAVTRCWSRLEGNARSMYKFAFSVFFLF